MENLNLLIVEDELIIYMHITKTLKKLGFKNIHTARNAKDAFACASKTKIDLLFSDIKIEGDMDGVDTAKNLQNLYGMPVIFITAYKDKEILSRVSSIDTIGYLLKPYRADELETLIELSILRFNLLENTNNKIVINDYSYNKKEQKLSKNNKEIILTKKEQLFISLLFNKNDSIVPYNIIDETVWFDSCVSNTTRQTFFYRIKNKLPDLNFQIEKNIGIGLL